MKRIGLILFLSFFGAVVDAQVSHSDFQGLWYNESMGKYFSISIQNDSATIIRCTDGKTLESVKTYWKENTLFAEINYFDGIRVYRFDLTNKKNMVATQMKGTYLFKEEFVKKSTNPKVKCEDV